MATEMDELLARTDAAIAKLRDELRLEERVRERILEQRGTPPPRARLNPEVPCDIQVPANGGPRPAGSVINGSLVSRIIGILRGATGPMKAKAVAAIVREQGYKTEAKAGLLGAVASQLSRGLKAGKFARKGRGRYALKSDFPEETT